MLKPSFVHFLLLFGTLLTNTAIAVEEPKYELVTTQGDFEIRHYAKMLIAETDVDGDMDEASSKGFRRIADFIFGNNQQTESKEQSKIAMTAPVTVEPRSMTERTMEANQWRIHFVMPSRYTLSDIPKPNNKDVKLREVSNKYFLVLKYSGLNTQARVQTKTDEARLWAKEKSLTIVGTPQLARYDPPWTLPMFRRNEIMIEITAP